MTAQQPLFQPDTHQPKGDCPACGGDGRKGDHECKNCQGTGNVRIPYE